jgi:hypothetical protein
MHESLDEEVLDEWLVEATRDLPLSSATLNDYLQSKLLQLEEVSSSLN